MKWYHMMGPGGTISCKGNFPAEAREEAAERWGCGTDEIAVEGEEPYYGTENSGLIARATDKKKAAAAVGAAETARAEE